MAQNRLPGASAAPQVGHADADVEPVPGENGADCAGGVIGAVGDGGAAGVVDGGDPGRAGVADGAGRAGAAAARL